VNDLLSFWLNHFKPFPNLVNEHLLATMGPLAFPGFSPEISLWLLFALGLLFGSFFNVVGLRLLAEQSVVFPASHCPTCKTTLHWAENIPVVSYLWLGACCKHCGTGISVQYPLIELLTGLLFAAVGWRFGMGWPLLAYLFLMANLVVITITDWKESLIFELNSLSLIPVGLLLCALGVGLVDWQSSLMGILAGFAVFEGMILLSRVALGTEGFGHGDTHLMMGIGAFLGWPGVLWAIVLGFFAQAFMALPVLIGQWIKQKEYTTLTSAFSGLTFGLLPVGLSSLPVSTPVRNSMVLACVAITLFALWVFLRQVRHRQSYTYMPLGPALIAGSLIVLFWVG
jgi:leader peptidase (prepilin peptidase) / N-methyltransferase